MTAEAGRQSERLRFLARLAPGLLLAAAIGALGLAFEALEQALFGHAVIEALVAAILIGIPARNLIHLPSSVDAGASYAAKQLLEFAVLLLGATIDLRQVLAAGPVLLLAIAAGVIGGIAVSYTLGRSYRPPLEARGARRGRELHLWQLGDRRGRAGYPGGEEGRRLLDRPHRRDRRRARAQPAADGRALRR